MKNVILCSFLAAALFCAVCGPESGPLETAGDVTETGNAYVAGKVVSPFGEPMAGVEMLLVPEGHNPVEDGAVPDSARCFTDSAGMFGFPDMAPGTYNVLGWYRQRELAMLIDSITAVESETLDLNQDTLWRSGMMLIDPDSGLPSSEGYLYVPGTDIYYQLDSAVLAEELVLLKGLPSGGSKLKLRHFRHQGSDTLLFEDMQIMPGDTTRCPGPSCHRPPPPPPPPAE